MAGISFGFTKTKEKTSLDKSTVVVKDDDEEEEQAVDFITSVKGRKISSALDRKAKRGALVIPMMQNTHALSDLEKRAVAAILRGEDGGGGEEGSTRVIEMSEVAKQSDVAKVVPAEEPELENYDEIPIEDFGLAMLRGMGWREGEGIGKNAKFVKPVEVIQRPKGLGLGASRKPTGVKHANGDKDKANASDEEANNEIKIGQCCILTSKVNCGLYGEIMSLDENNARVVVKLTVSKQMVTVSQFTLQIVSRKDYDKNSKYLNKSMADAYSRESEQKMKRMADEAQKNGDREEEEKNGRDKKKKKKHKKDKKKKHRSHQKESRKRRHSGRSLSESDEADEEPWLHSNLIVSMRESGEEVIIIDVQSPTCCSIRDSQGRVRDMRQGGLQQVRPRVDDSAMVMRGFYKGRNVRVVRISGDSSEVFVQTLCGDDVFKTNLVDLCRMVSQDE